MYRVCVINLPYMHHYNCIGPGVNGFTIYDTRLGSSSTSRAASGRVEVLTQRGWTPVCASNWGSAESRVLCHQLGYVYSSHSEKWMILTM